MYSRLLAFGGARVYDVKLPAKNPDKTSMELAYLFVDASTARLAQSLRDRGVMCLSSDYISDCIVMVILASGVCVCARVRVHMCAPACVCESNKSYMLLHQKFASSNNSEKRVVFFFFHFIK